VNSTRRAENQVQAQRQSLLGVEQDILLAAASAFMNVVREQAVLDLNISNEQVLRRQLEAAQDRFRVGEITRTDVSQAEARLAGATADRVLAEGTLEASRAEYLSIVGEAPGRLALPPTVGGLPEARPIAIERARTQHPDVLAAQYNEAAGLDEINRTYGELWPSVSVTGSVDRGYQSMANDVTTTSGSVRATVTVPLYQKGNVFSRVRAARQTAAQLRSVVDSAKRTVARSATSSWETLVAVRARIESLKAQIQAAEIALEGVQREAEVGSRTVLDVLDAEQELLDARVNLVRAERDEVVNSFALKEALGELTARNLGLPVEIYDPVLHYEEVRGKAFGVSSSGGVEPEKSMFGME
jgi:outer membrane protein